MYTTIEYIYMLSTQQTPTFNTDHPLEMHRNICMHPYACCQEKRVQRLQPGQRRHIDFVFQSNPLNFVYLKKSTAQDLA